MDHADHPDSDPGRSGRRTTRWPRSTTRGSPRAAPQGARPGPADRAGRAERGPGVVADVGCGSGQITRFLAGAARRRRGPGPVTGDGRAGAGSTPRGARFEVASMTDLPVADGAWAGDRGVVQRGQPRTRAAAGRPIAEFARVLRPGGWLLLAFHVDRRRTAPMGGELRLTSWFDHDVDLTFYYLDPDEEAAARSTAAGFTVKATTIRVPDRGGRGRRPAAATSWPSAPDPDLSRPQPPRGPGGAGRRRPGGARPAAPAPASGVRPRPAGRPRRRTSAPSGSSPSQAPTTAASAVSTRTDRRSPPPWLSRITSGSSAPGRPNRSSVTSSATTNRVVASVGVGRARAATPRPPAPPRPSAPSRRRSARRAPRPARSAAGRPSAERAAGAA